MGHSRIWAATSAADQLAYEYLANTRASEQWHKHEVEAGEIRKRIQDLLTSLEEQGQERKPLVLSQCKLRDREFEVIGDSLSAKKYSISNVEAQ